MKFIDCKNNLESVFFKLMNLPESDRCSILNSKSIHGWSELYEVNQYKDIEKAKHKKWLRFGYKSIPTRSCTSLEPLGPFNQHVDCTSQ